MTSVIFTVDHGAGPVAYSNYVQEADIWRDTQNGIGRWQVILDPAGAFALTGVFAADEAVAISIDAVLMMNGYIDDIHPHLDDRGYHTGLYRLTGRDLGLDLGQFFYRKYVMGGSQIDYRNTLSGNIIRDVLQNLVATFGAGNPEINPPAAGIGAAIDYDWHERTMLADGFKEIALQDNHDFYVDDATTNFVYFPVGTVASGVTLVDFPASITNNILKLDAGEPLGLDIKNYIEAFAGSLDDHYTELNGTDDALTGWNSDNATCTVGDNYTGAPAPGPFGPAGREAIANGNRTSVYCERSVAHGGNILRMYLAFGALTTGYNQGGSIDLGEQGYIRYLAMQEDTADGGAINLNQVAISLTDINGWRIGYGRISPAPFQSKQAYTADFTDDQWYEVVVPVGFDVAIAAGPGPAAPDWWGYDAGPGPFDWSQVVRIWFTTRQVSPNPSWFVVDGLQIPNVEVSALSQSAASIANYGYRMRAVDRYDIISQFELEAFTDDYLTKYEDPLETLKCTTIGQTGNNYAGENVEVVAPAFGIGGPLIGNTETYRILSVHHRVVKNSDDSDYPGFTFLTDYDLLRNQISGADQMLDPTRYYKSISPDDAWKRAFRQYDKYRRTKMIRPSYARG